MCVWVHLCACVCVGIHALYLIISVDSTCGWIESTADFKGYISSAALLCASALCTLQCVCVLGGVASLMYSLEKLPLVLADSGVVNLLHQLGVFVDQPSLPQHVSCCVLYLLPDNKTQKHTQSVSNR